MVGALTRVDRPARRQVEHELDVVRSAIALVADGGSNRVVVAGLRFGERLLPAAIELARQSGASASALWHASGSGCDIEVETGG